MQPGRVAPRLLSLKPDDTNLFREAVALLNRTQGNGLFDADYVDKHAASGRSHVVAAIEGTTLVGVGIIELIYNFDYYLPFDPKLDEELRGKKVGSFCTMSVLESRQGRGIGQAISQERLRWAREQKCDVLLGVSWVSGKAHTSNRSFEKLGFRPVKQLTDFYVKSSQEKPFSCPGCRASPCTCAAILYRLDLDT